MGIKCFNCNTVGHMYKDCPKLKIADKSNEQKENTKVKIEKTSNLSDPLPLENKPVILPPTPQLTLPRNVLLNPPALGNLAAMGRPFASVLPIQPVGGLMLPDISKIQALLLNENKKRKKKRKKRNSSSSRSSSSGRSRQRRKKRRRSPTPPRVSRPSRRRRSRRERNERSRRSRRY